MAPNYGGQKIKTSMLELEVGRGWRPVYHIVHQAVSEHMRGLRAGNTQARCLLAIYIYDAWNTPYIIVHV